VGRVKGAVPLHAGVDKGRVRAARTAFIPRLEAVGFLPSFYRAASRARKSPLGARWEAEFWARLRVDDTVTPDHTGAVARIELEVATALAKHLLAEDPGMALLNCRERLLQAMLAGSSNLPDDPWVCLQIREATVDKAVRQAGRERTQFPAGSNHG